MSDLPSTKTGAAKRVTVVGTGYVGISNAVLLAQRNRVIALDIDAQKVEQLNARISPIVDAEIEDYLANRPLHLTATLDKAVAYDGAACVIVATPTAYDPERNYLKTRSQNGKAPGRGE